MKRPYQKPVTTSVVIDLNVNILTSSLVITVTNDDAIGDDMKYWEQNL